jgi:iron complex transport system ATP-binding protein
VAIIRVLDVEVRYGSVKALENVSLEVEEGDILAVLGPNGSGKTTLLKTIDAIVKPVKGSIYIDGRSIGEISRRELAKIVSFVPQHINIYQGVKVVDFVLTGRRPHIGIAPTRRDVEIVLNNLRLVEAEHLVLRDITELSGGELQRILIARALASEPRILLLDEPTANLDMKYQVAVLELVKRLTRGKKLTVIMALHDLTQAYRYSTKAILLNQGKIVALGETIEVIREETIESIYGVKVKILRDIKAVTPIA